MQGKKRTCQQARYDDLQNKLAKDVAKGQAKLDAQMDKDFEPQRESGLARRGGSHPK